LRYVSTRGDAPPLGFSDVLLAGLAADGGLYLPETWPTLDAGTIAGFAGKPFAAVAADILDRFAGGSIPERELRAMADAAYATFSHAATAPLVQIAPGLFVLELFHGPTLAFKDVAMQVLARLMDRALAERGRRATIVGATSGDTGGAAIAAFRGLPNVDVFILFPRGRVSPVQQRQMTTADDPNVHAVAVDGSFDDCQRIVKALFGRTAFREQVSLAGVNSINWARIAAQTVYYFTAAVALGAPHRRVSFTVPTGNFGDVFAGYAAKRMGLPVGQLVVATNRNDILARALATGRYEVSGVVPTTSPSMDIEVSSNFERLIFEASGRDAGVVKSLMGSLAQSGGFTLPEKPLAAIQAEFSAGRADEAEVAATMRKWLAASGILLDPHSAVGVAVAERFADTAVPMVCLATAHPAKFPAAVTAATGRLPDMPAEIAREAGLEERYSELPADAAAVESFIAARSRAATAEV
jgi:threonine synthase